MTFEKWFAEVDSIVSSKCGIGVDDLPDMCYMDSFEDGVTPSEMAEDVFEENGVDW
jgi:hypothetical protein